MATAAVSWLASQTAVAQTPGPSFEVASVKANSSGQAFGSLGAPPGTGRFEATNASARLLILNAYGLRDFQLIGAPSWTESEHFDVAGRAAASATRDEISAMVRTLLADRLVEKDHATNHPSRTASLCWSRSRNRP